MVRAPSSHLECQFNLSFPDEPGATDEEDDSEEEFVYPASSHEMARSASRASSSTDYFSRASNSRLPADLTPQLTQSPEFRVPTHEAPQKVMAHRHTAPTPHHLHAQWERDEAVSRCRDCQRRFTFLNRRVCTCWKFKVHC